MAVTRERAGCGMSWLDEEIAEQPEALARLLDAEAHGMAALGHTLRRQQITSVVLAARGSSDNAARYAQYLLGLHHGLPVALAAPSLGTVYGRHPRFAGALVVGVSQSGASPDVVGVIAAAAAQGRPTVAVTNDPDSPLAAAAAVVLPLHVGVERSIAATKTYTCSLAALALLSAALEEGSSERSARLDALRALPAAAAAVLDGAEGPARNAVTQDGWGERCIVLGRGLNYSTAFEIALKLRELTGVAADPFSPPDLLHGPIAALAPGTPVVVVAPAEPSAESVATLLPQLTERGARTLVISGREDLLARAAVPLPLGAEPAPWLTPITAVLPGQLLAARLAEARGADPDRPRGLEKVTRTH